MIATGPLEGVKVVELAGIGPGPFAATILADLGADVIRIDRPGPQLLGGGPEDLLTRNRERVEVDLKSRSGVDLALQLIEEADILLEGMRPGVTERLGLGPDTCSARNPRLVYGRMTGWGQTGPLAHAAGHDLTYIAITGVLHGLGQTADRPQFPINLLGDFGGGSTFLVIGVLSALLRARMTGQGQVVDAAIIDGTSYLDLMTAGLRASGGHSLLRGRNMLDGGVPYYRLYRTLDDRWVAVGALEPQFFRTLVDRLGVADIIPAQDEVERHGEMESIFEATFASRTMADWAARLEGTDACVAPVLTPAEAAQHTHLRARNTHIVIDDVTQPAPAPRFSGTPTAMPTAPRKSSADQVLARWTAKSVQP